MNEGEYLKQENIVSKIIQKIRRFFEKNPGLRQPLGVAIPLVILIGIVTIINPIAISQRNIISILRQTAIYMVLGTGVTIVIGTGGLDLSVGSIVCLAACIAGIVVNSAVSSVLLAILAAVFAGLFSGAFNGFVVSYFKVPALITTLGTMTALRGVAYVVMKDNIERNFPDSFQFIGQGRISIIPMPVIIGLIILLLGGIILSNTRIGKYMLAIGCNEENAKQNYR